MISIRQGKKEFFHPTSNFYSLQLFVPPMAGLRKKESKRRVRVKRGFDKEFSTYSTAPDSKSSSFPTICRADPNHISQSICIQKLIYAKSKYEIVNIFQEIFKS